MSELFSLEIYFDCSFILNPIHFIPVSAPCYAKQKVSFSRIKIADVGPIIKTTREE